MSLLSPAIALLNRLSLGQKFALIGVLFALPVLAMNIQMVNQSLTQVEHSDRELSGLKQLDQGLALLRGAQQLEAWRNLIRRWAWAGVKAR